jgi:hypothetical protein
MQCYCQHPESRHHPTMGCQCEVQGSRIGPYDNSILCSCKKFVLDERRV